MPSSAYAAPSSLFIHYCSVLLLLLFGMALANPDARRLYDYLLRQSKYNKLVRPVKNNTSTLYINFGLRLAQILDVDEKNEIISLNMWVMQEWHDHKLQWFPEEYGGVDMLYVPSERLWLPDIVLYNNADGDYHITMMTKATLTSSGKVIWQPPAIYKFRCDIKVQYFPFDEQDCYMKFGSWSYDGTEVDMLHIWQKRFNKEQFDYINPAIDTRAYMKNAEWQLTRVMGKKNHKSYTCCVEPFPDITFNITIRRRTLFYTINLIIPCVAINLLTVLVFYLPSDSCEKISLSISILLSLSIFQLLLMELVPSTSTTISLLGKYLIFTTALVAMSVFCSVVSLNHSIRSSTTHEMSGCMKYVFLNVLPRILLMQRPTEAVHNDDDLDIDFESETMHTDMHNFGNPYRKKKLQPIKQDSTEDDVFLNMEFKTSFIGVNNSYAYDLMSVCEACARRSKKKYPPNATRALDGMSFIAKHLKDDDTSKRMRDDWKFVAMVIDRILLWVYISVCIIGAGAILLNAPTLYSGVEEITANDNPIEPL